MKKYILILVTCLFLFLITLQSCKEQEPGIRYLDLSGAWIVSNDSLNESFGAIVPGTIHTDLLRAGMINDPFKGTNEKKLQWVDRQNWNYSREFFIDDSSLIAAGNVELVFEGLDTRADVYFNDSLILMSNNMFRTWRRNVSGLIRYGKNSLEVHFFAAETFVDSLADEYPVALPDKRGFIRKAPYQFGWDWGPAFKSCGIWRPVYLVFWDEVRMEEPQIIQKKLNDDMAEITVRCRLESMLESEVKIRFVIKGSRKQVYEKRLVLNEGMNSVEYVFQIDDPELWWPNGMGNQHLYELTTCLYLGDKLCDMETEKFGLRTIEVINQQDSIGESFYFKVNGIPVFIKGANYIPQDNFLPRVSDEKYKRLIEQAVDANMNMLRVWGGGIYEQDIFYDICDREGIMLWQDFMFACNMYPGDPAFLKNVKAEARQNIKRLRNHPSLAMWCGNNEVSEGWHNWGWQESMAWSDQDSILLEKAYRAIFDSILPGVVETYDSGRFYWPGSPKYGWGREKSMTHGDSHYWGVWWGAEPFEVYEKKTGRFMSEYGFQAFPSPACIDSFAAKEDQFLYSGSMKAHQKHPRGFELIRLYMERDFPVPEDFGDYVYMSQILQTYGIKKAIHAQRRSRPVCMGSLYWQLNDCWPGISWSSIDYCGNPKALYYGVKKAYNNILISAITENNRTEIFLINDSLQELKGRLSVQMIDFWGNVIKDSLIDCRVQGNTLGKPMQIRHNQWFRDKSPGEVFLSIKFYEKDKQYANHDHFFVSPAELLLPEAEFDLEINKNNNDYSLVLSSEVLMRYLMLEAQNTTGEFSDNCFDLLPGEKRVIAFRPEEPDFSEELKIRIRTLNQFIARQNSGI